MTRNRIVATLIFLVAGMIFIFPDVAFQASLEGLKLWFEIVLPTLLPFFIMSELLMGFGVVHLLGALLEPVMRPLFRLPGVAGFAVAMGVTAGYPLGAKITGDLVRSNSLTQTEGERLAGFANTAGPLFLVGAVGVGMFGVPDLGITLLIAHLSAAVLVGFCLRLHKGAESPRQTLQGSYLGRALAAMDTAREKDGRSFATLFSDAIRTTFQSMLLIGGCIMVFSVLVQVLTATGVFSPLTQLLGAVLRLFGLDPALAPAVFSGFFETTLGAQRASQATASLGARATVASLIVGWSGLSVQLQAASMLTGTKIRLKPYLYARLMHGLFSAMITALLLGPMSFIPASLQGSLPVVSTTHYLNGSLGARFLASARIATSFLLILVIILSIVWLLKRMIYISFRPRA